MVAPVEPHPIRLSVSDDLRRTRLTVFFRLILAIPHLIWLALWGIVVFFAVIVSWFATLFAGRTPDGLHDFIAQYLRYQTHIYGYLLEILGLISWVACLVLGTMPLGLRNLTAWAVRFTAQTHGYMGLLTDRYPNFGTEIDA